MAADWNLSAICTAFSECCQRWRLGSRARCGQRHLGATGAAIVPLNGSFAGLVTSRSFEEAIDAWIRDGWGKLRQWFGEPGTHTPDRHRDAGARHRSVQHRQHYQLANGRVKSLAQPDIELNRSKSACVGIHELPPWWSKFSSAPPPDQFRVEINKGVRSAG